MGLFGPQYLSKGRFPDDVRESLAAEEIVLLLEGLRGSATYRQFRYPGGRTGWGREPVAGALAVTSTRLVVWDGRANRVDLPHDHPLRHRVQVRAERDDRLLVVIDVAAFRPQFAGTMEMRLRTPEARRIVRELRVRMPEPPLLDA